VFIGVSIRALRVFELYCVIAKKNTVMTPNDFECIGVLTLIRSYIAAKS